MCRIKPLLQSIVFEKFGLMAFLTPILYNGYYEVSVQK